MQRTNTYCRRTSVLDPQFGDSESAFCLVRLVVVNVVALIVVVKAVVAVIVAVIAICAVACSCSLSGI